MAKKMYIPVSNSGNKYKLFMDDIKKVHSIVKQRRPPVPSYNYMDTPRKIQPMTDIEFEPLFLN